MIKFTMLFTLSFTNYSSSCCCYCIHLLNLREKHMMTIVVSLLYRGRMLAIVVSLLYCGTMLVLVVSLLYCMRYYLQQYPPRAICVCPLLERTLWKNHWRLTRDCLTMTLIPLFSSSSHDTALQPGEYNVRQSILRQKFGPKGSL